MEHIPARHAAVVGMVYPATVVRVHPRGVDVELDLTLVAPGRLPKLRAEIWFELTVDQELAERLTTGDSAEVVLVEVLQHPDKEVLIVSLPADPKWLTWNNETVRRLARHIRETGETDQLPILADALEDAGCTDTALLTHCREKHEPGTRSWAIELLATQT